MASVRERHTVSASFSGLRLQEYLPQVFSLLPSRAGAKKAIKRGEVLVDGTPAETARIMRENMIVELLEGRAAQQRIYRLDLPILFEDEHLAIVNKPPGVPVSGNQFKTVQNALAGVLTLSSEHDALPIPLTAHRLDAPTSGLLIVAKTTRARIGLGTLFEEKQIHKKYRAIVMGETADSGTIDLPIDGKPSRSDFTKIKTTLSLRSKVLTLLELTPLTGRTHQLRIHCAQSGFPIVGDTRYGDPANTLLHKGLFLTATSLSLPHPSTGKKIEISIDPPRKFSRYLDGEKRRYEKYQE